VLDAGATRDYDASAFQIFLVGKVAFTESPAKMDTPRASSASPVPRAIT
jgi:hypothetical protein